MASSSLLMSRAPIPSPLPNPSAAASKVWHFPDGERSPLVAASIQASIFDERFVPPTNAAVDSPESRDCMAEFRPYKLDEHAVSIVTLSYSLENYPDNVAVMHRGNDPKKGHQCDDFLRKDER